MSEAQILPTLVQAGAVGISFALIWLLYWMIKKIIGNHLQHSTEIQREMTKAIEGLTKVIENLNRRLNDN